MSCPSFWCLSPEKAEAWLAAGAPAHYRLIFDFTCVGALRPVFVDWRHGPRPFGFDDTLPTVFSIGDDPADDNPLGPNGYDAASLERTLKRVAYIALIAGAPIIAAYDTAAWFTLVLHEHVLIIEARWTDEATWFALIRHHAPTTPLYRVGYGEGLS